MPTLPLIKSCTTTVVFFNAHDQVHIVTETSFNHLLSHAETLSQNAQNGSTLPFACRVFVVRVQIPLVRLLSI
jgi:hypothetical protein